MGCSCRAFREEPLARPCVSQAEPSFNAGRIARGFPGAPPPWQDLQGDTLGRGSRLGEHSFPCRKPDQRCSR
jgi:hypothetical protein